MCAILLTAFYRLKQRVDAADAACIACEPGKYLSSSAVRRLSPPPILHLALSR